MGRTPTAPLFLRGVQDRMQHGLHLSLATSADIGSLWILLCYCSLKTAATQSLVFSQEFNHPLCAPWHILLLSHLVLFGSTYQLEPLAKLSCPLFPSKHCGNASPTYLPFLISFCLGFVQLKDIL